MANRKKLEDVTFSPITKKYLDFIEQHVNDIVNGVAAEFMELNQIAKALTISHSHLTDIIQKETGHHPCHFYDERIIEKAKELLLQTEWSIANIAHTLTYDPSNFSKFFKKWTGSTPSTFRQTIDRNLKNRKVHHFL